MEDPQPALVIHVLDATSAWDPGSVDKTINPPEDRDRLRDHPTHTVGVTDVGADRMHLKPILSQTRREAARISQREVGRHDTGTELSQA